jgi:hypothetical protein
VEALGHREDGRLYGVLVLGALSNGASMQLQVNWRTPVKIRRVELTGTAGYAEINLNHPAGGAHRQNPLLVRRPSTHPDTHSYYNDYLLSFASPDRVELGIARKEPLQEELGAFWRAIQQGEPPRSRRPTRSLGGDRRGDPSPSRTAPRLAVSPLRAPRTRWSLAVSVGPVRNVSAG